MRGEEEHSRLGEISQAKASKAGTCLNYLKETGMLELSGVRGEKQKMRSEKQAGAGSGMKGLEKMVMEGDWAGE